MTLALLSVIVISTIGYHVIGNGRWSWLDCGYMTIITVATVGFGETLPGMEHMPIARIWTIGLILFGSGVVIYFASSFTAFIIEGDLRGFLRRSRMHKKIAAMQNHVVVCGVGTTGIHVVGELLATQTPFVVVEHNAHRVHELIDQHGEERIPHVIGDATDDDVLTEAGIQRARGVVAALHEDKDNLFVTVTARSLNNKARIVAKAVEMTAGNKLKKAGADSVVSPNFIGGMRMVSEMIRPSVVEFLDIMLRDKDRNLRIEQVDVEPDAKVIGAAIRDTEISKATDVLIIAIRKVDGTHIYAPKPEVVLEAGMQLVVLADTEQILRLRAGLKTGQIGRSVPPGTLSTPKT